MKPAEPEYKPVNGLPVFIIPHEAIDKYTQSIIDKYNVHYLDLNQLHEVVNNFFAQNKDTRRLSLQQVQ